MVQKITAYFLLCTMQFTVCMENVEVKATKTVAMPLSIWYIPSTKEITNLFEIDILKKNLLFLDQFSVSMHTIAKPLTKKERQQRLIMGDCIAIFILDHATFLDLYVHDLTSDFTVLGKRIPKKESSRAVAHLAADLIVEALTGKVGFFSTRIAYCKECPGKNKYVSVKQLCIADYDLSNEEIIVAEPSMMFGVRWNSAKNKPLLFYSEHTNQNIRLMVVDLQHNRKKIASNGDGITMLPAFMPDGQGVIYCATASNGFSQLYYHGVHKTMQLTHNEGNNIAPSITPDGQTVYFCSDYVKDTPQIFAYTMKTGHIEPITHEGYCTSPVVSPQGTQVVYTKMVQGIMQLFLYSISTNVHKQITFDASNKESHSWSPCGTYLIYGMAGQGDAQRIVFLNLVTGAKKYLTPPHLRCLNPSWSPKYNYFPTKSG